MLRVLHSVSNMARAGIETMLMNYYREIDRSQIQFDFLANKPVPGEYDEEIRSMGGRVFVSPGLNPLHYPEYKRFVADLLRNNPDIRIVHAHNEAMGYYALQSAKDAGIRVRIAHAHNTQIIRDYKYPLKMLCKQLLPGAATDYWSCGRDAGIYYYGEKRWKDSGFILRNAIDVQKFAFRQDDRRRLRQLHGLGDSFVIGHVGRFNVQKNHSRLLDIFAEVLKTVPDARLALIGTGELEQSVKEKTRTMKIEDNILFLGQMSNVSEWYQVMDCFVLPSLFEGLPVVGIEAQAAGLPCVFSDRVTDEVLLSPEARRIPLQAGDAEWAKEILAARKPETERIRGTDIVRQAGYDIHTEARKLQEIYLEMAARPAVKGMNTDVKKRPVRIAMIGHKLIPSRNGGVEVVVSNLAPHLAELGYDVTCYNRTSEESGKLRKEGSLMRTYRGVRLIWTPTVDRRGLAAMTSSIIATVMASFGRYDLIHYHTEGPCVLCWLPRLFGKKVVVTVHGLDHMRQKWGRFASAYIMQGEKAAVRHANCIIVLSEGVRTYFREKYGRKTVLIPNGIDPAETRPACEITKQFGLSPREYILFLGRLVPEKGIHYLIEAYKKLRTDKKLVIVGGTSDTNDYVRQLYDMAGDSPSIIFTGFQQGLVAEELYSNAYLYVLPSDLEGMPLTLLEAMNYGCCCVTSDIGECADVMDGCGFTFPKGNVEALRETLQDLCDDPGKVEKHRGEARKVVTSKYTWKDITAKTDRLYRKLLTRKDHSKHHEA